MKIKKRYTVQHKSNRDRWMVSYADFITLMFAVFVVLYAITNMSLEKHKAVMQAMNVEFNNTDKQYLQKQAQKIMDDISVIQHVHKLGEKLSGSELEHHYKKMIQAAIQKRLDELETKLTGQNKDKKAIDMSKHQIWLEIELRSLFPSASAKPKDQAYPVVAALGQILKEVKKPFSVGGYTDNIPIQTSVYPSNWELSASRAAAVVRLLAAEGIEPTKMSAIGFGHLHPIASNRTPEGRRRNRRIVLLIPVNGRLETRIKQILRPYTKKKTAMIESIQKHDDFSEPVDVTIRKINLKEDDHRLPPSSVHSKYKDDFNGKPDKTKRLYKNPKYKNKYYY